MSGLYTYPISAFLNGLDLGQLLDQINSVIGNPTCQQCWIQTPTVYIQFASPIPDQSVLDNIVATFTPVYVTNIIPFISGGSTIMTANISGTNYSYFGDDKYEIIISKSTQCHYNSLQMAITANNVPNGIFTIYPGTYVENNPIILPIGTVVRAIGTAVNTTIVAQNPTLDLFTFNQSCQLEGLTLYGSYGTGARGIYFNGSLSGGLGIISLIKECYIVDCNIAIESDGQNGTGIVDTIFCDKVVVTTKAFSTNYGIYSHSGGQFIGNITYNIGTTTFPITTGYFCTDPNTVVSIITGASWYCGTGILADNNSLVKVSVLGLQNNGIGAQIGPNGLNTQFLASTISFSNSTTYDLNISAINANIEVDAINLSTINNPNNVSATISYNAYKFGNYYSSQIGNVEIGSISRPSQLAVGQGLYFDTGITVLSNSNLITGTWVNNTTAALLGSGAGFNVFQDVVAGNCMYIGSNAFIYGLRTNILTQTTSVPNFADLVWEYWNGTVWTQFSVMQNFISTRAVLINPCISSQNTFHIRFGLNSNTPFALLTLNSINQYWVRLRIVNPISNIPISGYIKVHTTTTLIGTDGFIEAFGNARSFQSKTIDFVASNSSPGNQQIFLSTSLSVALTQNVLTVGNLTGLGFMFAIPIEMDISFPLKINISYIVDSTVAGNIALNLNYTYSISGTNLYLTATQALLNPNANIVTVPQTLSIGTSQNNTDLRASFVLNMSNFPVFNSASQPGQTWWCYFYGSLTRNSSLNVLDTFLGNMIIASMNYSYVTYQNGGSLANF